MKRTKIISFFLFSACFFLPNVVFAQVLSEAQPSVLKEDQTPPNYVYDLKLLIKKSRENIKNVDQKIKDQAVVKRNQKREEKAREYFVQAMKLQDEGRFEEARQLFEKAIRITEHPEMQGYIKESEHRAKSQENALKKVEDDQERRLTEEEKIAAQKVEDAYQVAVSLYKQQKFKEAKTEFQAVDDMSPDYKAVRSYLQIVGQDIAQQDNHDIKSQKKEIERQQKEVEISRLREKELWRKEIEQKEVDRKKQLQNQADTSYNEAIKLYQDKKYQASKAKFQEVDWVIPDFKATRAYLNRIDQDIENDKKRLQTEREKELEKQRWDEALAQKKADAEREKALQAKEKERLAQIKDQAEFIYTAAVTLFDKSSFKEAKEKFDEVEALYPDYRSTRNYLKKILELLGLPVKTETPEDTTPITGKSDEDLKKILEQATAHKKAEQDKFKKISVETDNAFNEAIVLYNTGHLIEAKKKFLDVDENIPDYKSTRSYLKRIDDDIELMAKMNKHEQAFSSQQAEIDRMKEQKEKANARYTEAMASFEAKNFVKAKAEFLEVDALFSDFKKTKFYLQRVDEEIEKQKEEQKRKELETKVEVTYSEAIVLYNSQQFEEAKKKFIEIEVVLPNYKDVAGYLERIDDDIIRKKEQDLSRLRELQVQAPYAEALKLYQSGDFTAAKASFLEVTTIFPDYKDTGKYLDKIDADIEKQKKDQTLRQKTDQAEALYKQAMDFYQASDFESAKDKFVKLEAVCPDYKETSKYLSRIDKDIAAKKDKDELSRRSTEAEGLYDQALEFYKMQEYLEARKKFMQIQVLYPNFRDTALYLNRIEKDIQNQEDRVKRIEQAAEAEQSYVQAMGFYADHKLEEAQQKFLETSAVDPNYKSVRSYLGRVANDIRLEAEQQELAAKEQRAEEPYIQAVTLYHDRDFVSAKEKFQETASILPDYKKTRNYLSHIDQDIREEKKQIEQAKVTKAIALYREGQLLQTDKKPAEAFSKFSELELAYPDYKNTRALLEGLKTDLAAQGITVVMPQPPAIQPEEKAVTVVAGENVSDEQVLAIYKEAVGLFKDKNYADAKTRFEELEKVKSGYRSTGKYLQSINDILTQKSVPEAQGAEQEKAAAQTTTEQADVRAKAESMYREAVQLYKNGKYDEARVRFDQLEAAMPNYKAAREYRSSLSKVKARTEKPAVMPPVATSPVPTSPVPPSPVLPSSVSPTVSSAKEADVVRDLSKRSEALYRQIKALSQDKEMASAIRTFAQVDRILSNLEAEQKRLAAQVEAQKRRESAEVSQQRQEEKDTTTSDAHKDKITMGKLREKEKKAAAEKEQERQEDEKALVQDKEKQKQKEMVSKSEALYQKASEAYKDKKYDEARTAFEELAKLSPGYKDSDKLMIRLEREAGEAKLVQQENVDRKTVVDLAERANVINLEVVKLTEQRNYEEVRKKFDELSGIFHDIQGVKERMMARRREFTHFWENRRAMVNLNKRSRESPEKFISTLDERILKERARVVFREGQQFYAAQSYAEAKAKFLEAIGMDPTLKAATTYVTRINRILDQQDFEGQKENNTRQMRDLERKSEDREGLSAETPDEKKLSLQDRSKLLLDKGTELYRDKRYREARIKFEELAQIGDKKQSEQAGRYLALIDKDMKKEKTGAEKDRQEERERYLRAKRDQERLGGSKGMALEKSVKKAERDLEIQRVQELRAIENDNRTERAQMLNKKAAQDEQAQQEKKVKKAEVEEIKIKAVKPVKNDQIIPEQAESSAQMSPEGTQPLTVKPSRVENKVIAGSDKAARRNMVQSKKPQLTTKEEKYRKALQQERENLQREEILAQKQREKENFEPGIEALNINQPVSVQAKAAGTVSLEKPVRRTADDEKRRLTEQREAIRKDFEAGVEKLYNEAVELFKKHEYEEAREDFLQVNDMIKGYQTTDAYLGQIEKILKASQKKSSVKSTESAPQSAQRVVKTAPVSSSSADGRTKAIAQALDSFDDNH